MRNITVAVYGSPDAGKSFLASVLAGELARQGNEVITVFPDILSPTIPYLFPEKEGKRFSAKEVKSLGKIASVAALSQNDVLAELVSVPEYKSLCLLGYAASENKTYYPPVYADDAALIRSELKEISAFLIYDCCSDFAEDAFSMDALMNADVVIRVSKSTGKDLSYFMSQFARCKNFAVPLNQQIVVLNDVRKEDPNAEMKDFHGRIDLTIPHDDRVFEVMDETRLLYEPISRAVDKAIFRLSTLVEKAAGKEVK